MARLLLSTRTPVLLGTLVVAGAGVYAVTATHSLALLVLAVGGACMAMGWSGDLLRQELEQDAPGLLEERGIFVRSKWWTRDYFALARVGSDSRVRSNSRLRASVRSYSATVAVTIGGALLLMVLPSIG